MPSKTEAKTSAIQPWHIALIVIALLLVGWQVFGMISKRETVVAQPPPSMTQPVADNPAKPGTGSFDKFQEKDGGR